MDSVLHPSWLYDFTRFNQTLASLGDGSSFELVWLELKPEVADHRCWTSMHLMSVHYCRSSGHSTELSHAAVSLSFPSCGSAKYTVNILASLIPAAHVSSSIHYVDIPAILPTMSERI